MTFVEMLVYIMPGLAGLGLAAIALTWQRYETRRFDEARKKRHSAPDASA